MQMQMPMAMMAGDPKNGMAGKPETQPLDMLNYALAIPFGLGALPADIVDEELPCEPTPQQCGGQAKVRIQILPSPFSPDVDWDGILTPPAGQPPKNGHFVAKVTNMTDYPFGPLRLGPREVGFLWVGTVGNGPSNLQTVALYKLNGTTAQTLARTVRAPLICHKAKTGPAVHLFPMLGCDQTYPRPGAASTASIESMTHLVSYFAKAARDDKMVHTSGLWVSCDAGCCQVQLQVQ
jgi:hypothetical protein